MFESFPWFLIVFGGPVVLGLVIAFALLRRRDLTVREKRRQDRKVDELYEDTPEEHRRAVVEAEAEERAKRREPAALDQ